MADVKIPERSTEVVKFTLYQLKIMTGAVKVNG